GIIYGSVMAIAQSEMKRMLAYSSVAQIGYIGLGIGMANPFGFIGAVLHILNHAFMKGALFLVAANLRKNAGHSDISKLDASYRKKLPWSMAAFTLAALSMKSVGEVMAIGRTFKEALQKGLRSLEIKKHGLESIAFKSAHTVTCDARTQDVIIAKLRNPNAERIFYLGDALRIGIDIEEIYRLTGIDRWFLQNLKEIIETEKQILSGKGTLGREILKTAKEYGFSDTQLAVLMQKKEEEIYSLRKELHIKPVFKLVDTCAAEFQASTPYYYSSYDQ
ncbi:MAG: proton-conducting transporter membrane subunit, partial [Candidatus Omnitrophota bacterium]